MTFKIMTLGCKLNSCESAAIEKQFLDDGFRIAEEDEPADVVVINSCVVTAAAVAKTRHTLASAKRENPDCVTVLCGCYPQSFPDETALGSGADIIAGNSHKGMISELVREYMRRPVKTAKITPLSREFDESCAEPDTNRTRAFIKVEDGCDRFCSYCIIPKARGRVRSLAPDKIARQAAHCVELGHKELVLTGVNLSCYGQEMGLSLIDAVQAAAGSGIPRLRLSSLEPEMLTPELICQLSTTDALCPHFHLSLQSGSDEVLKRMNRRYTTEEYRNAADKLRDMFPGCSITTDIIVGFPGETDDEFNETLEFARDMEFAKIHVFPYSIRSGTVAAEMRQTNPVLRSSRVDILTRAAKELELRFFEKQVGTVQTVLIERPQSSDYSHGFTENYTPVRINGMQLPRHTLAKVIIAGYREKYCIGRIID